MAYTCSYCTYLKTSGDWPDIYGNYWCEKKYRKVTANSQECGNFCKAYDRASSTAESYKKYSETHQSSGGCFITTIISEILNLKDSNIYLNSLRNFRDNYLQKNNQTIKILEEYDFIGPVVSNNIKNDKNRNEIASSLFINYIIPITDYIYKNDYQDAIKMYTYMVKKLINLYNLNVLTLEIPAKNNYDYNKDYSAYGHGKLIKKRIVKVGV